MSLTVCTGWSAAGWQEYGQRFWQTFDRYWPAEVRLLVYGEAPRKLESHVGRSASMLPLTEIEGCMEFIERHLEHAAARGRKVLPTWKASAQLAGYNFRFDAWKFCRQAFIPWHAARVCAEPLGTEFLAWLDGDVVTHRAIPAGFIEALLPKGKVVAYFGRHPKHSEIGFQLYRLPGAFPALERFRDLYATDEIFRFKEWHSAYAFDVAVQETCVPAHNLTPGGSGNVWQQSPLRGYTDHLKGKRKNTVSVQL